MSLDSAGFYDRVCQALGIEPGRGAKAKIAGKVGVTKTTAGAWEKGEMPGMNSLQSVARVAELSGTSLHWLLTGEGPMEVSDVSSKPGFKLEKRSEVFSQEQRAAIQQEVIEVLGGLGLLLSFQARSMADALLKTVDPKIEKRSK